MFKKPHRLILLELILNSRISSYSPANLGLKNPPRVSDEFRYTFFLCTENILITISCYASAFIRRALSACRLVTLQVSNPRGKRKFFQNLFWQSCSKLILIIFLFLSIFCLLLVSWFNFKVKNQDSSCPVTLQAGFSLFLSWMSDQAYNSKQHCCLVNLQAEKGGRIQA